MDAPKAMEVRRIGPRASVVDIRGDVTAASESQLTAAYEQAGGPPRSVVLNFSGLEHMDSGGIGMLVTLLVRANRRRQRVLAFGLSEQYRRIFELTRLDEVIHIFDDEPSALRAAGGAP